MPGRKDCITIKVNGIKEKVQKKVLLSTVMEAYELFKIDHPEVKVGKSTFANLRPLYIVPISKKDHSVCCCKYHENFDMICEGLRSCIKELPTTDTLIQMSVCQPSSKACNLGDCKKM